MLTLQLRPCYKIVYLGLKRGLLACITPSERGDTSEVLELEAANEAAGTDLNAVIPGSRDQDRQAVGEATSGVLEDTTFEEATHSSALHIGAGTFSNPRRLDTVISGNIFNDNSGNVINIGDVGNISAFRVHK